MYLLAEQRVIKIHAGREGIKSPAVQRVYPFSEMAGENHAFLIDHVVQVVDLNENSEEDIDFGDNFFRAQSISTRSGE